MSFKQNEDLETVCASWAEITKTRHSHCQIKKIIDGTWNIVTVHLRSVLSYPGLIPRLLKWAC